jgi:hypothetical protein
MARARISDAVYDWRATRKPERPWLHRFHQALTDKMYLCSKPNPVTGEGVRVKQTFAQALETIRKIVLPQAMPGVLTGAILAVGRGAGEVAPIMFTGAAYFLPSLPKSPTDQFMTLGYHIFVMSTQSPARDVENARAGTPL